MNHCGSDNADIALYLDHELSGKQLEDFHTHLQTCVSCRTELEAEQELSRLLHQSKPLYTAPESLRFRVASTLAPEAPATKPSPDSWFNRIFGIFGASSKTGTLLPNWKVVTVGLAVVVFGLAFVPSMIQRVGAADYVDTAVATHRSFVGGELPLEITSDSPKTLAAWFDGKVPFHFQLPTSQLVNEGQPVYQLIGGRLVHYKNSDVALVAYRMRNETISLLVASSKSATVAAGGQVHAGKLTFHYYLKNGFNVITWTNHDLTYALVSSPVGSAQHSCLVCHQSLTETNKFNQTQ